MKNKRYTILFSVFIALLLSHLFFKPLQLFEVRDLEGFYTKPREPDLSIENFFTGKAQKQIEEVITFHNGLHTLCIRIHNEVKYDVYHDLKLADHHFGKNGYIFEYNPYFYTKIIADTAKVSRYTDSYLRFVEMMKKKGIDVLWVIAPEKCYIYPEYLPESEKFGMNTEIANYLCFRYIMMKKKAPMIDFNYLAFKEKNKFDFPVMYKRGKHWSRPYALRCMDSLIRYMNLQYKCGPQSSIEYFETDNPYKGDFDQSNGLNLLFVRDGNNWTDARLKFQGDTSLKMLWFGDSFTHTIYWSGYFHNSFSKSSEFWYYNRERNTRDSADLRMTPQVYKTTENFKFIVIEFSAMNIDNLDWGTVDSLGRYCK